MNVWEAMIFLGKGRHARQAFSANAPFTNAHRYNITTRKEAPRRKETQKLPNRAEWRFCVFPFIEASLRRCELRRIYLTILTSRPESPRSGRSSVPIRPAA